MPGKKWTREQELYLRNNHIYKTCEEIGNIIGKTTKSVQHKYNKLELEKPTLEIGNKIHRLKIISKYIKSHYNQNSTFVIAECECGNIKEYLLKNITSDNTRSCGCYHSDNQRRKAIERNYKHGQSQNNNKLFKIWLRLKSICDIQTSTEYKYFGAIGVKVDNEWKEFIDFQSWAYKSGYVDGLTIKRYRSYENFCSNNCYWIDKSYSKTRLYKIWSGMFTRCYNTKFKQYCVYGGRGIKICNEWKIFKNFYDWSLSNGYTDDLTIDKIDNNFHYCPENCRWATQKEQNESRHNNRQILAFNEVKSLLHWTRDPRCKNDIETIKKRLAEGKSPEEAMST